MIDVTSGRFIQNHYKEAATAIHTLQTELTNVCAQLGITMEIFEQHFVDERNYLEGLKEPPPVTALKTQYVQALNDLVRTISSSTIRCSNSNRHEWLDARTAANEIFTSPASHDFHLAIRQARRRIDTAYSKLQNSESYVESLENNLQIEERWTNASVEYKTFYQETVLTNYE